MEAQPNTSPEDDRSIGVLLAIGWERTEELLKNPEDSASPHTQFRGLSRLPEEDIAIGIQDYEMTKVAKEYRVLLKSQQDPNKRYLYHLQKEGGGLRAAIGKDQKLHPTTKEDLPPPTAIELGYLINILEIAEPTTSPNQ